MRSFFKRDPLVVRTHSHSDAPLAFEQRTYPVLLLRPGGSVLTTDFTTLAEDLASHGHVVAGFDAPRRSLVLVESKGLVIGRAVESNGKNGSV
jgi:predicted dienelactone hydrolase